MGRDFTAKDFRTWAGTLICACALARAAREPAASMTARRKLVRQAIVETAQYLGNTPAVAKSSYVSSTVLRHFEEGRVVARFFESVEQMANCKPSVARACELALVRLLRDQKDHRKDVHPHLTKLGKVLMAGSRETLQAMH
jgi:DNA topoisomerase-1